METPRSDQFILSVNILISTQRRELRNFRDFKIFSVQMRPKFWAFLALTQTVTLVGKPPKRTILRPSSPQRSMVVGASCKEKKSSLASLNSILPDFSWTCDCTIFFLFLNNGFYGVFQEVESLRCFFF